MTDARCHRPFISRRAPRIVGIAHHEAGHALVAWHSSKTTTFTEVVISEGGGKVDHRRIGGDTESTLWDLMTVHLAGLAGEAVAVGKLYSLDAKDDLMNARRTAEQLVSRHGIAGVLRRRDSLRAGTNIDVSKMFHRRPDPDASLALNAGFRWSKEHLIEFLAPFKRIAEALLAKRRLTNEDLTSLLGPRLWCPSR